MAGRRRRHRLTGPKAHQRPAYSISRVENVLRKRGRGDSEEVSESNEAIVPGADQTPTLAQPRLLTTKALIGRPELEIKYLLSRHAAADKSARRGQTRYG